MTNMILTLSRIAIGAGAEILAVYDTAFEVSLKDDKSPLTEADRRAHHLICNALEAEFAYPVLSEESSSVDYEKRREWSRFWLVDPLDGTKEFIKRNGEFTVNIALIEHGKPVFGVVYAPVLDVLYVGGAGVGSFRMASASEAVRKNTFNDIGREEALPIRSVDGGRPYTVVASRSHLNAETTEFIENLRAAYGDVEMISSGSSLKLCLVAEGNADVYPRLAPTMEWDTAAAQAVVEGAGGRVVNHETGVPLQYNKPNLLNPHFVVWGTDETTDRH